MIADAYAGKPVLVTGGLGFIGSNLARTLVEAGARVTVIDALLPGMGGNPFNLEPLTDRVRLSNADLRDRQALGELVAGQEVVFHLAGQVSHVDSMTDPIGDLEINCHAHLSLLEACRHRNPEARVVFAASRQQYGRARYLPVDEEHPLDPVDVNGVNKSAAEAVLMLYHRIYGVPACSLRLTNTYGPRMQLQHPRQGFVAWFVRRALRGEQIELYGDGSSLRDFNAVRDVVDAFLLCGKEHAALGEAFNLGHAEPATVREFAELLLDVAGGGSLCSVPWPEDRSFIDIGSIYASYAKIRDVLGWEPKVRVREGLTEMLDYYREHAERYW